MAYLSEAMKSLRQERWSTHPRTARTALSMGRMLSDQGAFEQARPYYLESLEILQQAFGKDNPIAIESLEAMIELHDAWHEAEPDGGHDAKAEEYRAQLDAIKAQRE